MELRLYSFVNFYLSGIHAGIQTGHCAVDLVRKYTMGRHLTNHHAEMVDDWADNHKTFIILNGGDLDGVIQAGIIIQKSNVPFAYFYESQSALGGMLTCVACVLPETIFNARPRQASQVGATFVNQEIYEHTSENSDITPYYPNHQHYELIKLLRGSRLAL